jgi:DNA-binding response OmpR family regulator
VDAPHRERRSSAERLPSLSLIRRIVESHGGTVRLEGGETGALTFTLPATAEARITPFEMAELLERVEACLRVRPETAPAAYRFGSVEVDFRRAEVRRSGTLVALAAKELRLLRYFVQHRGELLTRNELLDGVWGYDAMPLTRTVDVHVAWLRKKLEPEPRQPRFILTVHKLGYKFVG